MPITGVELDELPLRWNVVVTNPGRCAFDSLDLGNVEKTERFA